MVGISWYIYISTHISKVFKVSGRYIHSYRCINQLLANGTMIGSRKGKNSIPCHAVPHWRDHGSRGEVIVFGGAVGVLFMGRTIGFNLFASISWHLGSHFFKTILNFGSTSFTDSLNPQAQDWAWLFQFFQCQWAHIELVICSRPFIDIFEPVVELPHSVTISISFPDWKVVRVVSDPLCWWLFKELGKTSHRTPQTPWFNNGFKHIWDHTLGVLDIWGMVNGGPPALFWNPYLVSTPRQPKLQVVCSLICSMHPYIVGYIMLHPYFGRATYMSLQARYLLLVGVILISWVMDVPILAI